MATTPIPSNNLAPAKPAVSKQELLQVRVFSPKREYYHGPAVSISSINSAGPFDILAEHGNFITLAKNTPIIIRLPNKQNLTFTFPLAVFYTRKNNVSIFTDIELESLPI
jgi:F0F1-type ATP synthase epsilon subunit